MVLYRAGRTAAGASASASHTAAIAGDVTVGRELARAAGVTIADTPAAFDDLVRTFALLDGRPARGRRLGAASNAGSECVTIADHAGALELVPFAPADRRAARRRSSARPASCPSWTSTTRWTSRRSRTRPSRRPWPGRSSGADEVDVGIVGLVPMTDTLETLPPGPGPRRGPRPPGRGRRGPRPPVARDDQAVGRRGGRGPALCPVRRPRSRRQGSRSLAHRRRRHAGAGGLVRRDAEPGHPACRSPVRRRRGGVPTVPAALFRCRRRDLPAR